MDRGRKEKGSCSDQRGAREEAKRPASRPPSLIRVEQNASRANLVLCVGRCTKQSSKGFRQKPTPELTAWEGDCSRNRAEW